MTTESLTESLRETLAVFEGSTPMTTSEVADRIGPGRRSTYERLQRLVERDYLRTKKVGASARVWWRPAQEPTSEDAPDWSATAESLVDDVLGNADVGVFVLDDEFEVAWVNEATERYFGLEDDELLGRDKRQLVDERIAATVEDPSAFADTVLATYDDNTHTERFECHVTAGDGREERWLEHRSKPIESGAYAGGRVELYYDVTERKETERAQRSDRREFERLVAAVEEYAIFTLDPEGHVRTWNPGAEAIKGYDTADIVGEHFSTFYTDEARDAGVPEKNLAAAAESGAVQDEGWRLRADGTRFWANVTITAIRGDDGELEGFAKVTRDMTERREYEQRLETQAERLERQRDELELELESVFDRVSDGFYGLDDELRFTYVNDRAESLLGIDRDAVLGRQLEDTLELTDRFEDAIHAAVDSREPVTVESFYDSLDVWFESTIYPAEDGLSVYFRDVTDRKEREHELERYETVVETMSDGVYVVGDGRISMVNAAYTEMTGYDRTELVGEPITKLVDEATVERVREVESELSSGERDTASIDAEVQTASGDPFVADARLALVSEDEDDVERVGVVRDVTEERERQRELERYEAIFQTIDDGVYAIDEDGRLIMVNDALCQLTGYDRDELMGMPASTVHPDSTVTSRAESIASEAVEGEYAVGKIEFAVQTKDGDSVPCESRIAPFPLEDGYGRCGVIRDVSDRLEREHELRDRVRQQEGVTALGQRALEDRDLDALMAAATSLVAETLDTDYCEVLDLDQVAGELELRQGVGWDDDLVGSTISAVDNESQAAFTLASREPVVVEGLETDDRFSGPDLLTSHGVQSGVSVVVGPHDNPWGILGTHDAERREFSDLDVNFVQSVANILATAISRHQHEQELVRQREQLAAMNSLNEVVREITDAVIDQSTRDQIEQTVCERLAATDSYMLAWIGDVDAHSQTVNLRAEAGVEGYLDGITISVDPDDERSAGPTGQAFRTGEVQTTTDIRADDRHDPWRQHVEEYGFHSSAAIPIVHEGTVYGVLNVYAERPDAFEGRERDVISQLGEVVGHAIAATERKRALMSDEVVELEFHIADVFEAFGVDWVPTGAIMLDRTVPLEDDEYLVYGTATADAVEGVEAITEAVPHWENVTFHDGDGETTFELRLTEPPVLSVLAALGGSIEEAVIEDGDYHMKLRAPPSADVRRIIDAVLEVYPGAELLRRRQVTRRDSPEESGKHTLLKELTDRQQAAIEAAYYAGFFQWPREATGEDLAQSLDVSPPTFHQHLRKAEQKVFEALLS